MLTVRLSMICALVAVFFLQHIAVAQNQSTECVTDYDADEDYFPDKATINYAQTFSVEYYNSYKVLTVTSSSGQYTYVLYQCGTPEPTVDFQVNQTFEIPVSRVATGTTDHVSRLELLGKRSSIVAYTSDPSYIGSACVDAAVEDGTVAIAVKLDPTCGNVTDNTVLRNSSVEVTFTDIPLVAPYCEDSNVTEDVFNGVAVVAYEETGPDASLAEAEAIKLFSLFYNAEADGEAVFEEMETLWSCTENNAQGCSLKLNDVPNVAWYSYVPTDPLFPDYASGWARPNGDTYYSYAIESAGGNMTLCPGSELEYMTDEEMLDCFGDADICVFAADYAEVTAAMNASALNALTCVQNESVFDITLTDVNAWFEAKTVEPHVLLQDLVVVLHGDDFNYGIGSYERLLLRSVFTEESGSGTFFDDEQECEDPDEALEISGECDLIIDFETCVESSEGSGGSHVVHSGFALAGGIIATVVGIMISAFPL